MTKQDNNGSNNEPCFHAVWQKYQGRGVLALSQDNLEEAVVQFSIAAFVLSVDSLPAATLLRAESLVALARVNLRLYRSDKALPLLHEAMDLRRGLLPECHTLNVEALHLLANAEREQKRYAEADTHYGLAYTFLSELGYENTELAIELLGDWLASGAEWRTRTTPGGANSRKSA